MVECTGVGYQTVVAGTVGAADAAEKNIALEMHGFGAIEAMAGIVAAAGTVAAGGAAAAAAGSAADPEVGAA